MENIKEKEIFLCSLFPLPHREITGSITYTPTCYNKRPKNVVRSHLLKYTNRVKWTKNLNQYYQISVGTKEIRFKPLPQNQQLIWIFVVEF